MKLQTLSEGYVMDVEESFVKIQGIKVTMVTIYKMTVTGFII
ncbi:MAG TPA: hypothetical protein VJ767_12095 [Nitrososphaeraceae archaeon]|nr:hypothetical protein [Nitrososphaeraceae archaeon]